MALTIKIDGPVGGGKTTVAVIIERALRDHGFRVDTVDSKDSLDHRRAELPGAREFRALGRGCEVVIDSWGSQGAPPGVKGRG